MQNLLSSRLMSKDMKTEIYRTIILPVILSGCETWSVALREERRLRLFRRIFGPKREEVTREWRNLHIEELNSLYCSPSVFRVIKSRGMRWAGHAARIDARRGVYSFFAGKPEGKRQLGKRWRKWEDNIKMDLQEVGCECMDWIRIGTGGGHL